MKTGITSKYKIWLVITVALVLVGVVLLSVLGFNQTAENKNAYELSVKAEANLGNVADVIKTETESYLADKGVKIASSQVFDDGGIYIAVIDKDCADKINTEELKNSIKTEFDSQEILSGLDVTVKYNETNVSVAGNINMLYVVLAAVLSYAAVFIYVLFMEKVSGALTVICTSVISALLFFALMGITRIPAAPFFTAALAVSALFSAAISAVIINRFKEIARLSQSSKSNAEIAEEGTRKSLLRVCFTGTALLLFGIALLIMGTTYLKYLGLQLIVADVCSIFSAFTLTGVIWKALKDGSGKKAQPKKEQKTDVE